MTFLWPALFVPAYVVHLIALHKNNRTVEYVTKPMLLLLLFIWYASAVPAMSLLVSLALLLGLAGDVLLMGANHNRKYFLPGLATFLVGHIAYLAAFCVQLPSPFQPSVPFIALMLVPIVLALLMYRILRNKASDGKMAILFYFVAIGTMNIAAIAVAGTHSDPLAFLPMIGAALFMVSDASLAMTRYGVKRFAGAFVMATYGLAQALLTFWFIRSAGGTPF